MRIKAENSTVSTASTTIKPTITISFADDQELYDQIVTDAKADRRTPAQFLLLHLAKKYVPITGN